MAGQLINPTCRQAVCFIEALDRIGVSPEFMDFSTLDRPDKPTSGVLVLANMQTRKASAVVCGEWSGSEGDFQQAVAKARREWSCLGSVAREHLYTSVMTKAQVELLMAAVVDLDLPTSPFVSAVAEA